MKTRSMFVSNSSSSSFIVALDKEYNSEDMNQKLFDGNKSIKGYYSDGFMSVESLMAYVDAAFNKDGAKIITFEQFCEAYSLKYNTGPDMNDFESSNPNHRYYDWDAYNNAVDEFKAKECDKIWPKYKESAKNGLLYNIGFGDDDQIGCELEHNTDWCGMFNGIGFSHH